MLYWIGIVITLLVTIIIFRVFVRRDYLQRGKLGPLSVTLEFIVFALHANVIYLHLSVPWPLLPPAPENPVQLYLGAAVTILGLLTTLAIMAHLGFSTTIGQQPGEVRQSGPYRWTRNPQILTYGVMLVGLGIMYPSLQIAAWILLYGAIGYLMVITEEEHLSTLFGEKYDEYRNKVPRFIINWKKITSRKQRNSQ